MKRHTKASAPSTLQALTRRTSGDLQRRADASAPVARLSALSKIADAARSPVQAKRLLAAQVPGDGNDYVVETAGFSTSTNFDTNHLVSGDVDRDTSEIRAMARPVMRNTIVNEAQLKLEVIDKEDEIIANAPGDAVTTLNFPIGTAFQSIKAKGGARVANTFPSSEVGIKARVTAPNEYEIFHLHESNQDLGTDSASEFPSLADMMATGKQKKRR